MTKKIFISYYSASDTNLMNNLKRAINKENGLEAVVVADRRSPGISLANKVKEGIEESDFIIPILSKQSIVNQWVNQEIGYATGLNKKIYPIVQKEVIDELKGFIHKNDDLPYSFEDFGDPKKNRASFRKAYKLVIVDIVTMAKIQVKKPKDIEYIPSILHGPDPSEIRLDEEINKNTRFFLRVKPTVKNQTFVAYLRFITDMDEKRWIAFSNRDDIDNKMKSEYVISIGNPGDAEYHHQEKIIEGINKYRGHFNIEGNPQKIEKIRLRGDSKMNDPIHFYYAIG